MNITFKHIKKNDMFEMQVIEPQLRAHFLLTRELMNKLRVTIEQVLVESRREEDKGGGTHG
ncbi:MAG: hypothetical protein PHS37_06875 [Candidatus Omnitrophica bacterium]|nr:hypothetical protein [Candidatus Omnitrophota bacterium]